MGTQSGFHYYLNWAKARIDGKWMPRSRRLKLKPPELKAEARDKANQVVANLRKMRDDFSGHRQ